MKSIFTAKVSVPDPYDSWKISFTQKIPALSQKTLVKRVLAFQKDMLIRRKDWVYPLVRKNGKKIGRMNYNGRILELI